jgi:hypothetical protein
VLADVAVMAAQLPPTPLQQIAGPRWGSRGVPDRVGHEVVAGDPVEDGYVERRGRRALLLESPNVEPVRLGTTVHQLMDRTREAVKADTTSVRSVKSSRNRVSVIPCGWSTGRARLIRSTMLTTRTRNLGRRLARMSAAATVSMVTTSPAQASTTSGSRSPSSVPAQVQIPAPLGAVFPRRLEVEPLQAAAACR